MNKDLILREILKPETYLFKNYKQKLITLGVEKNDPLFSTLDILLSQTYASLTQKKMQLESKFIKKLKILSILSCFYGNRTYQLSHVQNQLVSSREECLNLLVEASIYKLINLKIDQAQDSIKIVKCKIREREAPEETDKYLRGKFTQIKQKNEALQVSLKTIIKTIAKDKGSGASEVEEEEKYDPFRF